MYGSGTHVSMGILYIYTYTYNTDRDFILYSSAACTLYYSMSATCGLLPFEIHQKPGTPLCSLKILLLSTQHNLYIRSFTTCCLTASQWIQQQHTNHRTSSSQHTAHGQQIKPHAICVFIALAIQTLLPRSRFSVDR